MGQSARGRRGVVRVLPRPDAPPATLERQAEGALTAAGILEILGHEVDAVRADPLAGRLAKAK
jgi:hypothetical protein